MQVRIANRQDEPAIRTFVDAIYQKSGRSINLESEDSDLRNIEANYFGKEGLFILAESESAIAGIAAARKKDDTVLELKRFMIADQFKDNEVVSELLDVIVAFAPRLLYAQIDTGIFPQDKDFDSLFVDSGFLSTNGDRGFSLSVTPDF